MTAIARVFTPSPSPSKAAPLPVSPSPLPLVSPSPTQPLDTATPTITTLTSDKDGMLLLYVPAGTFKMGSLASDPDASAYEKPQHDVSLDAYWIDKTEVTNAMFTIFVNVAGYQTDAEKQGWGYAFTGSKWEKVNGADFRHPNGPASDISSLGDHPVVQVSWNDAQAYCAWAGRRLPTEAEWEKAARWNEATQQAYRYPWGDTGVAGNLLNFADVNFKVDWADKSIDDGYQFTAPVGSYPDGASPYGVLDMAGNVWEWVADWYGETYYTSSPAENPQGPATGQSRVLRGGSWVDVAWGSRAALRGGNLPDNRTMGNGFRCVR